MEECGEANSILLFLKSHYISNISRHTPLCILGFFFLFVFWLFRAAPMAYVISQARGEIRAAVAGLHHNHSNAVSKMHLQHSPQLIATPDP